jgi:hypothetical protein
MPGSRPRSIWSQVSLCIHENALGVAFWVLLFFGGVVVLYVLKLVEILLRVRSSWPNYFDLAFSSRISNPSLWCFVVGCATGLALLWANFELKQAKRLKDWVPISPKAAVAFLVLILMNWGLYIQAIFRDGGTFAWAIGDGLPMTRVALHSTELPMTGWDGITPQERKNIELGASNHKWILLIQIIEGALYLFVLVVWAFVGVLANVYVTLIGKSKYEDRKTALGKAARVLLTASVLPFVLVFLLSVGKALIDYKTGIASAFLAWVTQIAIAAPLGVAAVRVLSNCGPAIPWWGPNLGLSRS